MTFADLDAASVLLRTMTYVGTIAVAGGVLFALTQRAPNVIRPVRWQAMVGAILLLVCEPMRYALFQLSIAQGDIALAFDPSMRWLGVETPLGQASLTRLAGLAVVLLGLALSMRIAAVGALVIVGSFLVEGHTASSDDRFLLAPLLLVHLLVAHWWLGALLPLRTMLGQPDVSASEVTDDIHRFGRHALVAVGILFVAGVLMLAFLTQWQFDPFQAYQQGFLIKFGAFLLILLIAAINKLRLTPLLSADPNAGRTALRRSISFEIAIASAILFATALATSFPPVDH